MATKPVARKVKYTKGKSVKKTEPYYGPVFANTSQKKGVNEAKSTIDSYNHNWKETPKWQRVTVPLRPKYTSKRKKR